MAAETKVVINGPQGERSSWEKEYLDSGKQCLKGLKKQLDPRRSSWERERATGSKKEKISWLGTITGVARREKQLGKGAVGTRGKEAREQLGLEEKLGRAVTKLVCL